MTAAIVRWLEVSLVFLLFFVLSPGDLASRFAGKGARPELISTVRHELHFDTPPYEQYGRFLWRFVNADLGHSYYLGVGVGSVAAEIAPVTGRRRVGRSCSRCSWACRW